MYSSQFIHSSFGGHLNRSHLLAVVHDVAMHMGVQISFSLFCIYPEIELLYFLYLLFVPFRQFESLRQGDRPA